MFTIFFIILIFYPLLRYYSFWRCFAHAQWPKYEREKKQAVSCVFRSFDATIRVRIRGFTNEKLDDWGSASYYQISCCTWFCLDSTLPLSHRILQYVKQDTFTSAVAPIGWDNILIPSPFIHGGPRMRKTTSKTLIASHDVSQHYAKVA